MESALHQGESRPQFNVRDEQMAQREHRTAQVIQIDALRTHPPHTHAVAARRWQRPPNPSAGQVAQLRGSAGSWAHGKSQFPLFMTLIALFAAALVLVAIAMG